MLSASDDENASKRGAHRSGGQDSPRTAVRNSHSRGPRTLQRLEVEHRRPAAAAEARNCTSASERCKAQSFRCQHSIAKQMQSPMPTPRMLSQLVFFPWFDIPPVVWPIEPNNHRVVAQKRGAPEIIHRRENGDIFAPCLSWVSDLRNQNADAGLLVLTVRLYGRSHRQRPQRKFGRYFLSKSERYAS